MAKKAKVKLNNPYILNPNGSKIADRTSVRYYDASKRKYISIYFDLSVQDDMKDIESYVLKHLNKDYLKPFGEEVELDEFTTISGKGIKYDNDKKGWFDDKGKRFYLSKGDAIKLMTRDIKRKQRTGDWVTPMDLSKL